MCCVCCAGVRVSECVVCVCAGVRVSECVVLCCAGVRRL